MTTRDRQLEFICGSTRPYALADAAKSMVTRHGADWLTDEQVRQIFEDEVARWKFTQRLNRKNRAIARGREAA